MKKSLGLLLVLILNSGANPGFSQFSDADCPQMEKVRGVVRSGDSIARFMDYIKNNAGQANWSQFMKDAKSGGGLNAFYNFGARGADLRERYSMLAGTLDEYTRLLITSINPTSFLTNQQVKDSINALIGCYFSDTVENNIDKLFVECGREAPDLPTLGPCERDARDCLSNASQNYHQNLIACGFGGLSVQQYLKGWWGLAAGFGCFVIANSSYNSSKWSCFQNYSDCIGN